MGKIDIFSISLEKPNAIYNGGENLKGSLNINVKERLKINCVKMLLNGSARVHWSESSGSGKSRRTVHYSANQNYLNHEIVFLSKNSSSDLYLEPGSYSYPFDIALPTSLPTSFEHHIGQVRYSLYGTIDIPWAFDKHTTRSFTVLSHFDLNAFQNLRQGFGVSDQKVLCCGPCKSDPITANFNIFKSGFVPGEGIAFNATIDNKTSRKIKTMSVSLVQVTIFHSTRKSKTVFQNITKIDYPNVVNEKSFETWSNSMLLIPAVCSSSDGTCRIIEVSYKVVFNFDASGIATSKNLEIPITIGTIPFHSNANSGNVPYTYESSALESNQNANFSSELGINTSQGETYESDLNSYKPFYPFYKDFSLNNPQI